MKNLDYFVLFGNSNLRFIYICKGFEDFTRIADKISFAVGRIVRKSKCFECFEKGYATIIVSKGNMTFPSPFSRDKVIRGKSFKSILNPIIP